MSELASSCFGRTEIAASDPTSTDQPDQENCVDTAILNFATGTIAGRDRAEDLSAALRWNSGEPLFHAWVEKVNGALAAAYSVFLHLLGGGSAALDDVLKHPTFVGRKRQHTGNLALIALQFVAGRTDTPQGKALSEYALFLKYAALQQIGPDDFPVRMADVTLKSCKALVRARTKKNRACSKIAVEGYDTPSTTATNPPKDEEATADSCDPSASPTVSSQPIPVTAEAEAVSTKLLSVPWEQPKYRDAFHLLCTLAQIVDERRPVTASSPSYSGGLRFELTGVAQGVELT